MIKMKKSKTSSFVPVGNSLIKYAEQRAYEQIGYEAHSSYNTDKKDTKSKKSTNVVKL